MSPQLLEAELNVNIKEELELIRFKIYLLADTSLSAKCDIENSQHGTIVIRIGCPLGNDHACDSNFCLWDACSLDVESPGARGGPGKRFGGRV